MLKYWSYAFGQSEKKLLFPQIAGAIKNFKQHESKVTYQFNKAFFSLFVYSLGLWIFSSTQSSILASLFPPLLYSCHLSGVNHHHQYLCSLVFTSDFIRCPFRELSGVSYKGDSLGIYFFDEISTAKFGFGKFSCSSVFLLFLLCL